MTLSRPRAIAKCDPECRLLRSPTKTGSREPRALSTQNRQQKCGCPGILGRGYGDTKGDVAEIRLVGPDGTVLSEKHEALTKDQPVRYHFGGVKRKGSAFPIGRYVGEYRLIRCINGQLIPAVEAVRTILVQ
jgi:hypothetical protein